MPTHKILFAASEAHPLIKTGGLGDVAGSLPIALQAQRQEVCIIMPAYHDLIIRAGKLTRIHPMLAGFHANLPKGMRLLEGTLPNSKIKLWLVDAPAYFDRPGNPYLNPQGTDWPDNAQRFALFARVVAAVAMNKAGLAWQPDIVHCNDWQCGLIPALLSLETARPATVFTVHNLAYQGLFPAETFAALNLPASLWGVDSLEFYGQVSFIKGGLAHADMISTVSPTYAQEIRTPAYGCGLEGLLNHRAERLTGILNGADYTHWDPQHDPLIPHHYNAQSPHNKADNKAALQTRVGLPVAADIPVFAIISRLVEQKGIDLLLGSLPELLRHHKVQFIMLGNGEPRFEKAFSALADQYPTQVATKIGFNEELAHLIESGADSFVMPSFFEPCGLNQIYSLRYGTVPIVRRTGGLADTVVDATPEALTNHTATGIVFNEATPPALLTAFERALALYQQPARWQQMVVTGMKQDFSWKHSAKQYLALYQRAVAWKEKDVQM
jgi:starch synthase